MSKVDAWKKKDEEEEKKVTGQQQKTQSDANKPKGTTSIPKDNQGVNGRTQEKSTASSLRTENNTTTVSGTPRREESKQNIIRQNTITANKSENLFEQRREKRKEESSNTSHGGNSGSFEQRQQEYEQQRRDNARRNQPSLLDEVDSLPMAPGSGMNQLSNLDEYTQKNPNFDFKGKETIDSRKEAEKELNDYLFNRSQLKEDAKKDANTLNSFLSGAGSHALGVLGDLIDLAQPYSNKKSTEGMTPDEIYNRAMNTQPSLTDMYGNNIVSDYDAYKNYVLDQMSSGAITPEELKKMKDLEEKYSGNPAHYISEFAKDARAMNEGFSEGHEIANMAGSLAPLMAENIALGPMAEAAGAAASTINNPLTRAAAIQGANLIPDVLTDTLPEVARNINENASTNKILSDAAKNVALNEVANLGFEFAPKAFKAIGNKLNGSNTAKRVTEQAVPEVAEQIAKTATDNPYVDIPELNVANNANRAINNDLSPLKDDIIGRIAKNGGDNGDAFADLVRSGDAESLDYFNQAMKDYNALTGGTQAKQLDRLNDVVNGRIPEGLDAQGYGNILNSIDNIEGGLNRIGNLEGLSDLGRTHLNSAYDALNAYEDAVRNGGDADTAAKELSRVLGNLDNQAKKVEGYDGIFSQWKGGGTARGDLFSNTNQIRKPLSDDIVDVTPEEAQELTDLYDFGSKENQFARPANQIPEAGVIPETNIPKTDIPEIEAPKKVSQTYTNTGKRGGGWNEEEYTKYTDPKDYLYETKSEVDSVARAEAMRAEEGREAFKERVFKEERVSSEEIDGLMMEWRELTEEARNIEANGGDASQLWAESNRVFRKIREQSTNNAQALQALAKWSRNTPEGMLAEAENIVNGNVKVEKGELQKQLDKFAKGNKQQVEFSPDFQKQFLELAEEFKKYDPDSREAKDLMGRMGKLIDSQVPKKLSQKVQTWLMDSMLGNFRTLISRNAGGNLGLAATEQIATRPLAAGIDSLVSLKTGKRTQAGFSKQAVGEYLNGMKKGIADEIHDLKTGLHTARTGENTLENAIKSNSHVFQTKILDKFDSLVKNGLSMGDRPFYEATYAQTLGDYYRLRPDMGPDIAALTDDQFKEYAETAAHLNALAAVYQNDSKLAKGMLDLKNAIGQISQGTLGVDVLSQFSMPFVKTPANVIDRAIDYSPVGALRNTIRTIGEGGIGGANFDQNRFVNETARNIIGTGITAGGAGLAYANRMSGSYSDDADEKKAQQDAGMQEYALNVPEGIPMLGGKQVDIGWMPIVGSNLVAGAAAYDAYLNSKDGSDLDNLYAGIAAGGNELFGQAAMQGAQRLFGGSNSYNKNESLMDNAKNVVAGGFSQAIPSIARQIAQVADPYKRDVGNSNEGNYELNQILNALPYFRQNNLVPKVDSSGNPVLESQGRDIPSKIIEDMILPGRVSEVQYNRLDEEAMALSEATGNKFSYMPKAERKNVEDEARKLTNDEWYDYQVKYGQSMTAAGEAMINNELYANMNATQKEAALQNIYTAVKSCVNNEYKKRDLDGAAKVYANDGLDAAIDYVIYGQMKNQIDTDGNGSIKQDEVLNFINNGHQNEAEKIWNRYKGNSKKELQKNSNDEWELTGGSNKTSSSSKKTSSAKKTEDSEKFYTGNPTLDARIKAKQKAQQEAKAKKTENAIPEVGGSWSVESNGKTYDLKKTKTYQRAQSAGWSDSDFLKHFHGADADHGGTITKAEAKAYIDALSGLSRQEKHDMFEILRTRKAKNPY